MRLARPQELAPYRGLFLVTHRHRYVLRFLFMARLTAPPSVLSIRLEQVRKRRAAHDLQRQMTMPGNLWRGAALEVSQDVGHLTAAEDLARLHRTLAGDDC